MSNDDFAISIKNLTFTQQDKIILNQLNLSVKKNEFVSIVGEVGSGKSSLFAAILGFAACSFSEFKLFDRDALSMSLMQRRSFFSFVPQDLFIMNANIRDNVALHYQASKENDLKIFESLNLAQFDLKEENFPGGLETEIGERGVNLSGGQKQRISIARAYYMNKDIVLLDDCLSALDVQTEDKINSALLSGAWKNKTRILVTHRPSILSACDRVLYIENGCII